LSCCGEELINHKGTEAQRKREQGIRKNSINHKGTEAQRKREHGRGVIDRTTIFQTFPKNTRKCVKPDSVLETYFSRFSLHCAPNGRIG
jgi:hypothetical protein